MTTLQSPGARRVRFAHIAVTLALLLAPSRPVSAAALPVSWQVAPPPLGVQQHTAIVDAPRHRMVVYGKGDFWAFDLVSHEWTMMKPGGGSGRSTHSAVFDQAHDRMLVYGGRDDQGYVQNYGFSIALTSAAYATLPAGAIPGFRADHVALSDPARNRMILLGGTRASWEEPMSADSVFAFDLNANTWSSTHAQGPAPYLYGGPIAALDAGHDRVLALAGGVYQLTLSNPPTWSQLSPTGTPPPDLAGRVIGDPDRGRLILVRADMSVWALSFDATPAWTQLFAAGPSPSARANFSLVLDADRNQAVLFGGIQTAGGALRNDTWRFDLVGNAWSLLSDPGTLPVRMDHAAAYVPGMDAMLVFGGGPGPVNDVLVYPLDAMHPFTTLATSGTPPAPRLQHSMAYDPVRNRLLVFGGTSGGSINSELPPDVFALTLDGTPTWSTMTLPGGPRRRMFPSTAYDPVRDRLIVFGGQDSTANACTDVWALTLSGDPTWQLVMPDGQIPWVIAGTMVYDPSRDDLVVLGTSSDYFVHAWKLNLSGVPAWTSWQSPGGPEVMYEMRAVLDPYGDRVLFYGGKGTQAAMPGEQGGVLRSLSLATPTWNVHSLSGSPQWTARHSLVHDPTRFRTVMFGGIETPNGAKSSNARFVWLINQDVSTPALVSLVSSEMIGTRARIVWQVSDGGGTGWSVERSRVAGEWEPVGTPDVVSGDRLEFIAGDLAPGSRVGFRLLADQNGVQRPMGETWIDVPARTLAFRRAAITADGLLQFEADLPAAGTARLEAFDVGGRRLGEVRIATGADGTVRGELSLGSRVPSGLCLLRLSAAGHSVSRKLVIVR